VQLGEAEALGMLHHHDRGGGDIDPDLDHRRRHQQVEPALGEGAMAASRSAAFMRP
jgi:hypothetical protein